MLFDSSKKYLNLFSEMINRPQSASSKDFSDSGREWFYVCFFVYPLKTATVEGFSYWSMKCRRVKGCGGIYNCFVTVKIKFSDFLYPIHNL